MPKISVVIPAYNEERALGDTLRAVKNTIHADNLPDTEVVVVNNASTDRTGEVARSFEGVVVVDEPRKGLTRARQAGFMASRGLYIANVDADTLMHPGWLREVVRQFESTPRLVGLSGPYVYWDLPFFSRMFMHFCNFNTYFFHLFVHRVLGVAAFMQGGNFIIRRTALEAVGGYDTSIEFYGEDSDIATRVARLGLVRWTFRLPMRSSGRRFAAEGVVRLMTRYVVNMISTMFFNKPLTAEYKDIRK